MSPRGLQISSVCTNFHFFGGLLRWLFIASCKTRHFFNSNYIYNIYIHIIDIYIYTDSPLLPKNECSKPTFVVPLSTTERRCVRLRWKLLQAVETTSRCIDRGGTFFPKRRRPGCGDPSVTKDMLLLLSIYIYIWNFCYIVIYSHPPKKLRLHGVPKLKWDEHFFFGSY